MAVRARSVLRWLRLSRWAPETDSSHLRQQVEQSWAKESRVLRWLGVRDGQAILEVGCGPGYVTERLIDELPNSHLTVLDRDPEALRRTLVRVGSRGRDRLVARRAAVEATGLPADVYDVVLARCVFQHLRDPLAAAVELRRVLKPGGLLVVTDNDDDLFGLVEPPVPELAVVLDRCDRIQSSVGGNRRIGRRLRAILTAVGFEGIDLEVIAFDGTGPDAVSLLPQLAPPLLGALRSAGHLTAQEEAALAAGLDRFAAATDPYVLRLLLMASGRKPSRATARGLRPGDGLHGRRPAAQ